MQRVERRPALLSRSWFQAALLVILFGFTILLYLAVRAHVDAPPIPSRVVDSTGRVLFTGPDILAGQEVFLRNGLMEYGSIFGHGAYLGPDYTADYLRRAAQAVRDLHGGEQSDVARAQTIQDFKTNRYDPATDALSFTPEQAQAFAQVRDYYQGFFSEPSTRFGLRPGAITDQQEITQLTAFFAWSAWPSRPSTPLACSPAPTRTSPPPTSGASRSSTSGSRTSWSCSPRQWSPTSSCCSEWSPNG